MKNNHIDPVEAKAAFEKAKKQAERIAGNKEEVAKVLRKAYEQAGKQKPLLRKIWSDLTLVFRMIKAWITKEYTDLPIMTVILSVGMMLYFINPFDIIPDFIPVIGLMDDIALSIFVFNSIRSDMRRFEQWELANKWQKPQK